MDERPLNLRNENVLHVLENYSGQPSHKRWAELARRSAKGLPMDDYDELLLDMDMSNEVIGHRPNGDWITVYDLCRVK